MGVKLMIINKPYKFRIYPNKTIGCFCIVFDQCLTFGNHTQKETGKRFLYGVICKNEKSLEEKIVKEQRQCVLSRELKVYSCNKQRIKVARIHGYMTNARKDYLDKSGLKLLKITMLLV